MQKFEPKKDWMLLKLVERDSLLVISEDNQLRDDNSSFLVLQVGPRWWENGVEFKCSDFVKPGDEVIMEGSLAVAKFMFEGERVLVGKVRDIALIVHRESITDEANRLAQTKEEC